MNEKKIDKRQMKRWKDILDKPWRSALRISRVEHTVYPTLSPMYANIGILVSFEISFLVTLDIGKTCPSPDYVPLQVLDPQQLPR